MIDRIAESEKDELLEEWLALVKIVNVITSVFCASVSEIVCKVYFVRARV